MLLSMTLALLAHKMEVTVISEKSNGSVFEMHIGKAKLVDMLDGFWTQLCDELKLLSHLVFS